MIRSCQIMLQLQASIQGNRTNSQVLKSPTRPGQPATLPPGILLQNKPAMLVQQQPAAVTVSASNIQQVQVSTGSSGGGYLTFKGGTVPELPFFTSELGDFFTTSIACCWGTMGGGG